MGFVGLSVGIQDPRGPLANCGTHRANCRYGTVYDCTSGSWFMQTREALFLSLMVTNCSGEKVIFKIQKN